MGEASRRRAAAAAGSPWARPHPYAVARDPELAELVDQDRRWFIANPGRTHRLRKAMLVELPPGAPFTPGCHVVVIKAHRNARVRIGVERVPPELAGGSEADCLKLLAAPKGQRDGIADYVRQVRATAADMPDTDVAGFSEGITVQTIFGQGPRSIDWHERKGKPQ